MVPVLRNPSQKSWPLVLTLPPVWLKVVGPTPTVICPVVEMLPPLRL